MASTGFTLVGAGATVNTGAGNAWSNPGNITNEDNVVASVTVATANQSDTLRGSSLGFSIPSGAVIEGIEVRFQLNYNGAKAGSVVSYVNVGKADATLGTNINPATALTATPADYTYGSSSDLWGLSWTADEINASTFQALLRISETVFASDIDCDAVWVNVHYNDFQDAAADSSGTALSEMVGAALQGADADSSGIALSEAEGETLTFQDCDGLSDGSSVAEANGDALADGDADSSGVSEMEAVGAAESDANGLTAGIADPEAVGAFALILDADASSDGVSIVEAVGASSADGAALSDGSASLDAEGEGGAEIRQGPLGGSGVRAEASAWRKPDKTRVRHRQPRQIEVIKVGKWPEEVKPKPERLERIDYGKIIDQRDPEDVAAAEEEEALIAILALAA